MKGLFAAVIAMTLAIITPARAEEDFSKLFGMRIADAFTITASELDRDFHIIVRLPVDYDESSQDYPIIYLLDGGISFPMLAPYHMMMTIDNFVPDAIIVGISYGGLGFEDGNMRSTDYTAPSPERDYYGGAPQYQKFLETELLPAVEQRYRTDAKRRIIYGQSIGGQFVLYTALTRPDLFWGHIAVNPALHRNLEFFRDFELQPTEARTRLFVSSASEDDEVFRIPAREWIGVWEKRNDAPFNLHVEYLDGERHASSGPRAYRAGLRWLFDLD